MKSVRQELSEIDLSKDQRIFSIRKNGENLGGIEIVGGKLITYGSICEGNTYNNALELMWELQGHGISFDDLYY